MNPRVVIFEFEARKTLTFDKFATVRETKEKQQENVASIPLQLVFRTPFRTLSSKERGKYPKLDAKLKNGFAAVKTFSMMLVSAMRLML